MVWLGTGCFSPLCTFALYTQNAHRILTGQVNWMNESVVSWKTSSLIFSSLFAYMIRLYINSDVQNPIFVCVPQKKLKNSNPGSGWAEVYEPESIFDRNGKKKKKKKEGSLSLIMSYEQLQCSKEEILAVLTVNADLRDFCFLCV